MKGIFQHWGFRPRDYASVQASGVLRGMTGAADAANAALGGVGEGVSSGAGPGAASCAPLFGFVSVDERLAARCGPLETAVRAGWWSWIVPSAVALAGERTATAARAAAADEADGRPLATLRTQDGRLLPLVYEAAEGGVRFAFDVDATINWIVNERYFAPRVPSYVKLGVNPDRLPAFVRSTAFRILQGVRGGSAQDGPLFPARPEDIAVDAWRWMVRGIVEAALDCRVMPFWPPGKAYAVALTHDIDTRHCFRDRTPLEFALRAEERRGLRSVWFVVGKVAMRETAALDDMAAAGHEIGLHGVLHDHRLPYLSAERMAARLDGVDAVVQRYGMRGFRSPCFLRSAAMYDTLRERFEYDMSMHDVADGIARPQRQREGCSTVHPFAMDGGPMLQLPTTVREDWWLALENVVRPDEVEAAQQASVEAIRRRGGLANVLTHPEPTMPARWMESYDRLLEYLAADDGAWHALPHEICTHWQVRTAAIRAMWAADGDGQAVDDGEEREEAVGELLLAAR